MLWSVFSMHATHKLLQWYITKNYLKNQGGHQDSTNIAINVNFMTPNFLKQLLHALGRMDQITFWSTPKSKRLFHFLLEKTCKPNV